MLDRKHLINFYDQPFINYHSEINNCIDKFNLSKYSVNLNEFYLKNPDSIKDKSILHVYFGFGNVSTKYQYMKSFFNKHYEEHINNKLTKVKNMINDNLIPIINSINEPLEGSLFNEHYINNISDVFIEKQYNLCNIVLKENITNILEIGFNAGFSTLLLLETNPFVKITCVDICEHKYTLPCYEWISNIYPNRIIFKKGDSKYVLKQLINENIKFDLVHIDGGHEVHNVFYDCLNTFQLINKGSIIIMDDYDHPNIHTLWNLFSSYYNLTEYESIKSLKNQNIKRF
jgi:predicted O-methyltransferase YrrM